MRIYILLVAGSVLAFAGCASSRATTACDPTTQSCTCGPGHDCAAGFACGADNLCTTATVDAPIVDPMPDAPPKKGFGDPCQNQGECQSQICILVGLSGVCSRLCNDDCPADYGCFGVIGSVDANQVSNVCVPTSNQLCTPCQHDSECTLIGQDLCLPDALGDKFCARDCSTVVDCPTGYTCDALTVNGTSVKQCLPNSGACDCVAANVGMQRGCSIATPAPYNTTCGGTLTCNGNAGWGACTPPASTDDPDDAYTDANCDGIDGDVLHGIFVSSAGSNSASCGLTPATACQTVAYGVIRGAQTARTQVYVQTGTYTGVVVMVNGISIYGGYDINWQRGPYSDPAHRVTLVGAKDTGTGGAGEFLAVRAHDLIVPVTIDDLIIDGPTATDAGKSSYGVHVFAATITLHAVQVIAGDGAAGSNGTAGTDASSISVAGTGATGGAGNEYTTSCDNSSRGGGGGGATNACASSPSARSMSGGTGGAGGLMDTTCSCCSYDFNETAGLGGGYATYSAGAAGAPGGGGPPNDPACNGGGGVTGGFGNGGAIANGGGGSGAVGATLSNGYWSARSGSSGGTGENGGGGGGGGGSGGCGSGVDAYGAGGGGGGAGGCAARGGGGGAGGGGGSFGVFAANGSTATLTACVISRGTGGAGGIGGTGGRGQPGGGGGPTGNHPGTSPAGSGGSGGHGGHGGGGGGGAGGRSVGVAYTSDSAVSVDATITGGSAGGGGLGGVSAPAVQGTFEDDGNDGTGGVGGSLDDVRACGSTTSC